MIVAQHYTTPTGPDRKCAQGHRCGWSCPAASATIRCDGGVGPGNGYCEPGYPSYRPDIDRGTPGAEPRHFVDP